METYELRRGPTLKITLRVRTSDLKVLVSAPWFVPRSAVDRFVAENQGWIDGRRRVLDPGPVVTTRVWGIDYPVRIISPGRVPRVVWGTLPPEVVLRVPGSWGPARHRKVLENWEADLVREALAELVPLWEAKTGQKVDRWTVKRLRSRWGSCRPDTRSLVFNARLGALPRACLEHVLVHELAHLVEPRHNSRFHGVVEGWLPRSAEVEQWLRDPDGPAGPAGPGV